jgi:hypothetical protein
MSRNWKIGVLASAAALVLGVAGQLQAKPTLQEDFRGTPAIKGSGGIVQTRDGRAYQGPGGEDHERGSWVEYELDPGFDPQQGTVELDLTRSEKQQDEALVTFADATGERLVVFAVHWEGLDTYNPDAMAFTVESNSRSGGHVFSESKDDFGISILVPGAYPRRRIGRGQTAHVAMTWGPRDVKIYVDGQEIQAIASDLEELPVFLGKARKLIVGAQTSPSEIPGGAWSMTASLISNLQLHDRQLQPNQLAQAIVPAGMWFGARHPREGKGDPEGFTLIGCTVAPGFEFADFEMGERQALTQQFPAHRRLIEALT